jgi:hypothetical protein
MMSEFNILIHRSGASLHLKLMGELDKLSVRQVIHTIQHNLAGINRIFLHTNGLNKLCSANPRELFGQIPEVINGAAKVFFTGQFSPELTPRGCEQYGGV